PALTGIFEGDLRFVGNYRSQWNTIPVGYRTFSGAVDMSFYNKNYEDHFFSGGLLFNHDEAADSDLTLASLGLSGSYTKRMGKAHFLTIGLSGMVTQRSFNMDGLRFDSQFNTQTRGYDASLSNQENFSTRPVELLADVSVGLNWHYRVPKRDRRTNFDVGLGILHLNQPNKSFEDLAYEKLPIRWSMYAFSEIQLRNSAFDIIATGIYQYQEPHREIELGVGLQLHLDTDPGEELALNAGIGWRNQDAFTPFAGLRYRSWDARVSYDVNTNFVPATNRRGAFELSVLYTLATVKPMVTKICPVYL
ncbi:MAG: PorP/SprF family type IX secretion system membrane protein, partial [Bacteroidota bacterium]